MAAWERIMGRGGRDGAGRGWLAVQGGGLLVVRGDDLDRGGRGAGRGPPALPGCSGRGRGPGDMMIDWVSPPAGMRPAVYLWHGQFLSRDRTCEAISELFGGPGVAGRGDRDGHPDRR